MKKLKKQKGITLVALVVTIIVLIILAGVSINLVLGNNGIITIAKKAKENTELAKIQEEKELNELYYQLETTGSSSGDLPYDAITKLSEFKKAIANAINEAGGTKTENTAETNIFVDNIKGIVKEVTKRATATSDNISEEKTAWINGEAITGTGIDVTNAYNSGYEAGLADKKIDLSNNYYFSYNINDSDMNGWKTMHTITQDGSCLVTISFISKNTTNNICDFVNCRVVDSSRKFDNYTIFN